jgi:hypothetical protein
MGSYKTQGTITEIDRMALSSWYEGQSVPRSTAFKLVKLAGIKTETMKVPSSRAPVAAINAEQRSKLDALAQMLQNGVTMAELERQLAGALVATSSPAETVSDSPAPEPQLQDHGALLARLEAGERALNTGLPLSTPELAWLLQARPGGERVQRAGVVAIKHGRNCWQLRRSEPV